MATRTSDSFPQEYLEQIVTDLKVGEHSVVHATALVIDEESERLSLELVLQRLD